MIKQTFGKFDYEDYVARTCGKARREEKTLLNDAILADALGDYNFKHAVAEAERTDLSKF